jgi:hypothetical protein
VAKKGGFIARSIDVNLVRIIAACPMLDGTTVEDEPNAIDDPF